MKELIEGDLVDSLLSKINILENQLNNKTKRITDLQYKYNIAVEGLKVIFESGDCGGIAEKTIEEIEHIN